MERCIHSGIYWRTVPEPEAEERFKEEKEPVCSRSLSANSLRPLRALAVRNERRPFYFTITPDEYIEMKKADCEIEGKESADRRAAWHRQKKSRSRDWHHEERQTKNN